MYLEKSIKEYTDLMISESSYPGSESSLALTGTLATSLILFYFKSIYEKKNEEKKLELKKIIKKIKIIKTELMQAVDEATEIYKKESKPKEVLLKEAVIIPLLIAQKCNNLLELIIAVNDNIGLELNNNKYACDLFVGVYKIRACLVSSLFCVENNLQELEKGDLSNFIREEKENLINTGEQNYNSILNTINTNVFKE